MNEIAGYQSITQIKPKNEALEFSHLSWKEISSFKRIALTSKITSTYIKRQCFLIPHTCTKCYYLKQEFVTAMNSFI